MIKKLKNSINYLRNIGVHSGLSEDMISKVRMINSAALIAVFIDVFSFFLAQFVYQSNEPKALFLILTVIVIELFVLVLNALLPPKIVFYYIIIVLTVLFTTLKLLYFNNWGEQFIFLIIIYVVFLLFNNRKEQFLLVFGITMAFITADIFYNLSPDAKTNFLFDINNDSRVYLFIVYVVLLTFLMNLFHKRTLKARKAQQILLTKLQHQNEEIQKVSREVERFNFIASHDLKSPLRNIISFIGLTKIKLKRQQYHEVPEQLDFIENAAEQMNALIDDILIFSKINNNKINETTVHLNDLLYELTVALGPFLQEHNGQIIFNNLPVIHANPNFMKMLFQNFIKNAILYNQSVHPTIEIVYTVDEVHHIFQFKDNGIGIKEDYQDQIFEYFKRLHTYQAYKGTGLGLGISKKIIEKMNGQLSVDSKEGKGSVFTIQLPLNDTL